MQRPYVFTNNNKMADNNETFIVAFAEIIIFCLLIIIKKRKKTGKPKFAQRGLYKTFLEANEDMFKKLVRVNPQEFTYILDIIKPLIYSYQKSAVPPDLKLLVTLHFLAHGSSKLKTAIDFDLGEATISRIINEVCDAIISKFAPTFLPYPTVSEWSEIEEGFSQRWNFPNALGTVDGKIFRVQTPGKHFVNITILAVVDHEYKFRIVNVGELASDEEEVRTSFGHALYGNGAELNWPESKPLPGSNKVLTHFLLGNDAFQLGDRLMKAYPGPIGLCLKKNAFNFRISRARKVADNAFGILCARWRIFQTAMFATSERSKKYIYSSILLHNMLCTTRRDDYCYLGEGNEDAYKTELNNSHLRPFPPCLIRNSPRSAGTIRNDLADYFMTEAGRLS